MSHRQWSSFEKWGIIIAVMTLVVGSILIPIFLPEIRIVLHLDKPHPPPATAPPPKAPPIFKSLPLDATTPPKIIQHSRSVVTGNGNVVGNNVAGNGNVIGNNNQTAPTTILTSPDPYVGQDNKTVGEWAIKESGSLQTLATKCEVDNMQGLRNAQDGKPFTFEHWGPELPLAMFLRDFEANHRDVMTRLHQSLTFRLGPDTLGSSEFQEIIAFRQFGSKPLSTVVFLCHDVEEYAPLLGEMGNRLKAR
jgi:hypothetical protein